MNELALIFRRLGIDTLEVLETAGAASARAAGGRPGRGLNGKAVISGQSQLALGRRTDNIRRSSLEQPPRPACPPTKKPISASSRSSRRKRTSASASWPSTSSPPKPSEKGFASPAPISPAPLGTGASPTRARETWYVVRTKPRQESRAREHLARQGFLSCNRAPVPLFETGQCVVVSGGRRSSFLGALVRRIQTFGGGVFWKTRRLIQGR